MNNNLTKQKALYNQRRYFEIYLLLRPRNGTKKSATGINPNFLIMQFGIVKQSVLGNFNHCHYGHFFQQKMYHY